MLPLHTPHKTTSFGGHNILVMVFRSLYQSFSALLGMVGLSPITFALGIAGIVATALAFTLVQSMRGKSGYSIEPEDTPQ